VVAESMLLKQQLLILNRSRNRSPRLQLRERLIAGLCALLMRPRRLVRVGIVLKPSTLLRFHRALTTRKYRYLLSSTSRPEGPQSRRDGRRGRHETTESHLGLSTYRAPDHVGLRRAHEQGRGPAYSSRAVHAETRRGGTVVADAARSCEGQLVERGSVPMRIAHSPHVLGARGDGPVHASHRRFGVHRGAMDGVGLCRIFNRAIQGQTPPNYLSSDHDRLFQFHRWQANLRVLDAEEIKTVPYAPWSHPFVERLIGTIRRECLDRTLFWTAADLERKLSDFQRYYNEYRAHTGVIGRPPVPTDEGCARVRLRSYRWQPDCRGLYQTRIAA
jgi:putative transposase